MASLDEFVISGISCRLPMSDNMDELKNNLLNGVDMVTTGIQRMNTGDNIISFSTSKAE